MDQGTLERRGARNSKDEMEPNMARRLWHVVRAVLFMLRKGVSKRKLAMDLNLLLQRGKVAGKSLSKLMNTNSQHNKSAAAGGAPPPQSKFSWRAAGDPALAVYDPRANREVEFSCSNTPSYPSFQLIPTGGKRRRRNNSSRRSHRGANGDQPGWYNYDAADIARVFEILNNSEQMLSSSDEDAASVGVGNDQPSPLALVATPSPALWASFGRTPAHVRQLRITDSPFPVRDDASSGGNGEVDLEAEEFIKRFYEQLRKQQSLAGATPDCGYGAGYARPVTGMA